jgi:SET domain-containing protein
LKVQEKEEIPKWGVIGEYTGTRSKGRKPKSKLYLIEKEWIDAENEGNTLRFINHRCQNPNAVFISVFREGKESIFVKVIRKIKGGEFISINYGPAYSIAGCQCLDCISNSK